MVIKTMNARVGEFLLSEANGHLSRETVTVNVPAETTLQSGTILAIVGLAAASVAVGGSNTGDGTFTLADPSVVGGAVPGDYVVTITEAATDGGNFQVEAPSGEVIGLGSVGAAFADQIAFTIADGATDFAVGDTWTVTVEASDIAYSAHDTAGTDGEAIARAVLLTELVNSTESATTETAVIIARSAEVFADKLIYETGATTADKAAANAQLAASGIVVRS